LTESHEFYRNEFVQQPVYYFFLIFKNLNVAETLKMEDFCHLHHYAEKHGYRFMLFPNVRNQYPVYQHNNPEDINPQHQYYGNLRGLICEIYASYNIIGVC
jgi:hypothetical protein